MASIWRHPKSRYWTACFTDHTGKQRKRSTKLTDRKKALKLAGQLEEAYRNVIAEVQARRIISDIHQELHGRPICQTSVSEYFERWLARKKLETQPSTSERYKSTVDRFLAYLGEGREKKDLSFLSSVEIAEYRDHVAQELSISSANAARRVLRTAFQDAWRDGLISENPVDKVQGIRRRDATKSRRPFALDELKRLLEVADGEWKGVIYFGIYTGQRLGDIVRLTWRAIDLERQEVRFVTEKTRRRMILPLATPLLNHILSLPIPEDDPDAPLFPAAFDTVMRNRGKTNQLSNQFYDIMVDAGMVKPRVRKNTGQGHGRKREAVGISFHCLRHTATSLLKNAGASEAVTMDIVGHDSKSVSLAYTTIEDGAKRRALNLMPDLTTEN